MKKFLLILTLMAGCALQAAESVVLYYTQSCPYCHEVMDYLHSIHKTVDMVDITDNYEGQQKLKKASGNIHVPCLVVDGKAYCGSDKAKSWLSQHKNDLAAE